MPCNSQRPGGARWPSPERGFRARSRLLDQQAGSGTRPGVDGENEVY